jgi:hypothetical protein
MANFIDELKFSLASKYIEQIQDVKRFGLELSYIVNTLRATQTDQDMHKASI